MTRLLLVVIKIGWFCGPVPVVVLVCVEQLEGLGGLAEDANGFGAARPGLGGRLAGRGYRRSDPRWP